MTYLRKHYRPLCGLAGIAAIICFTHERSAEQTYTAAGAIDYTRELEKAAAADDLETARSILALPPGAYDVNADKGDVITSAIAHDRPDMLDLALRAGANPDIAADAALKLAAERGDMRIVKMLLDAGGNANAADDLNGFASPQIIAFMKSYKPDARYYGVYGTAGGKKDRD